MSPGGTEMIIDKVMPDFDAVRAEHRVIVGTPAEMFAIALEAERIDGLRLRRLLAPWAWPGSPRT